MSTVADLEEPGFGLFDGGNVTFEQGFGEWLLRGQLFNCKLTTTGRGPWAGRPRATGASGEEMMAPIRTSR